MKKIFYVSRTEDESTGTAGEATLIRASDPIKLQIVDSIEASTLISPITDQLYATVETGPEILVTADTVQSGDYNPVTSDAVCEYIADQIELSEPEFGYTISTSSSEPTVIPYDGFICFGATAGATWIYYQDSTGTWKNYSYSAGQNGDDSLDVYPVQKGDVLYSSRALPNSWVRWYKKRDYSKRS